MFDVFIAVLATWQIVEIWHHSLLFAPARSYVELWENKLGELLGCPFCLSPWISLLCVVSLLLPTWLDFESGYTLGLKCVIYAFAVSRLANLANDLLHEKTRTPKPYADFTDNYFPSEQEE